MTVQGLRHPAWACPETGLELEWHEGPDGSVLRPAGGEGPSYPVVQGIPRFVGADNYADSFGLQWNRFQRTQLDSHTKLPITRDRLRRCFGDLWDHLAGTTLLECGCGAGRFTEILLQQGALVTSLDLSTAVEANQRNFPISEQHRIAQADLLKPPFRPRQFQIVMCLGVIQHTPEPEQTIRRLYEQVRPGGWLIIDHYKPHLGRWTSVKPLFRAYLKRQSPERAMRLVDRLVDVFYPWHLRFRRNRLAWSALCRISPLTSYLIAIPELNDELQREWCALDTHDSLTDWFKWLRTKEQIRRFLAEIGAVEIVCDENGNGVEARCRRPA